MPYDCQESEDDFGTNKTTRSATDDPYEGARKEVVLLELVRRYNIDGPLETQRWVLTLNSECRGHISNFADDLTYLILDSE